MQSRTRPGRVAERIRSRRRKIASLTTAGPTSGACLPVGRGDRPACAGPEHPLTMCSPLLDQDRSMHSEDQRCSRTARRCRRADPATATWLNLAAATVYGDSFSAPLYQRVELWDGLVGTSSGRPRGRKDHNDASSIRMDSAPSAGTRGARDHSIWTTPSSRSGCTGPCPRRPVQEPHGAHSAARSRPSQEVAAAAAIQPPTALAAATARRTTGPKPSPHCRANTADAGAAADTAGQATTACTPAPALRRDAGQHQLPRAGRPRGSSAGP